MNPSFVRFRTRFHLSSERREDSIMSWKSTEDKQRFFEDLDKAFNTPASQALILPQIKTNKTTKPLMQQPRPLPKRQGSTSSEVKDFKRQRLSTENMNTTGVGIRPVAQEKSKQVKRPSLGKKRSSESQKQADEKCKPLGLLTGMVLFFIPNSKKNGVRRLRMTGFAQHGADVRDVWSDEITHVICDKSITGERMMRDLHWEQFPVLVSIEISKLCRLE